MRDSSGLPGSEAVGHRVEARAWGLISTEESTVSVETGSRQVLGAWTTLLSCERVQKADHISRSMSQGLLGLRFQSAPLEGGGSPDQSRGPSFMFSHLLHFKVIFQSEHKKGRRWVKISELLLLRARATVKEDGTVLPRVLPR